MKHAKLVKIGALLLSFALLTGVLAACGDKTDDPDKPAPNPSSNIPENFQGIDFSNGNIDFLMLHYKPFDSSPDAKLELAQFEGMNAAKITPDGDAVPYVAIDACSLLGDRITDVRVLEVLMAVEHPDQFYAVEGQILAYSGEARKESRGLWSIFLDSRNPNIARMELRIDEQRFVEDAYNMFIINRKGSGTSTGDTALNIGKAAGNLYILRIGFLDAAGNYLPVDADAKFNEPEGFNESSIRYIELGVDAEGMNNRNSDTQWGWLTDGTDGKESPYLAEDFAAAQQLVLEFTSPPRGQIQIIWHGSSNGWTWQELVVNPGGDLETTELIIDLTKMNDYDKFQEIEYDEDGEVTTQIKMYLGYFGYSDPCTECDDASCDLCNRNNMVVTTLTVPDLNITRAYLVINE
jgi:hypothetical protein